MKRIIFTLAGLLLISLTGLNAQNDTTRIDNRTQQYRTDEMVVVEINDIPAAVIETLKDPKYKGWEEKTVYMDPATGDYIVEIEAMNASPVQYRVDKNGNVADDASQDLDNENAPPRDPSMPEQDQDNQNQKSNDPNRNLDKDDEDNNQDSTMMQQQDADRDTSAVDNQVQQQYRTDEMVVVEVDDLPVPVVETLKNPKYNGWEKRAVFLDPASGEYIVEVEKAGELPHHFRFDREGQDISDRDVLKKNGNEQKKYREDHNKPKQNKNDQKKDDY